MSLIDELKRRNVFRVSAAYLALGWIVTQVTATVTPAFNLPASALTLVTWVGVIGFPFVVVFSWVYELTPEGLKRESEVDRNQSITHLTSRRLDYIIIAMLALAMGLFVLQYLRPPRSETPAPPAVVESTAAPAAAMPATAAPLIAVDDKSIAVLPFVDMSAEKNQDYMSDGIAEELLNLLAKVPELKVIARTSSFAFKGEKIEIAEIARKLNVAHVLEGSIRKSGSKIRITAQLIRATDSSHLWSETYDRSLDDIFAVQDEIATAVVEQLKIKLLGAAPKAKATDPKAYALFLQGRQVVRQRTAEGYTQAIALYQQALAIDPGYAAAWVGLSEVYTGQVNDGQRPIAEGVRLTREAVDKALALDPDLASAHAGLGWMAMTHDGDLAAAAQHYTHALTLAPDDTDVLRTAAVLALSLGRLDTAIAIDEAVTARDPVSAAGHASLGFVYLAAARPDDTIASYRTVLALSPGYNTAHYASGIALLQKGEPQAALTEMQQEPAVGGWGQIGLPMVWHALGEKAKSDAALAELIRDQEKVAAYNIAYVYAYRNDADRAFEWLDKAVAYQDGGLSGIVVDPLFGNIKKDPRWLPFLRKIGKAPEQLAAIKFEVKVPQ